MSRNILVQSGSPLVLVAVVFVGLAACAHEVPIWESRPVEPGAISPIERADTASTPATVTPLRGLTSSGERAPSELSEEEKIRKVVLRVEGMT